MGCLDQPAEQLVAEAGIELGEPGQHVETLKQGLGQGGVISPPARRIQVPQQPIARGVGRLALLLGQHTYAAKLMKLPLELLAVELGQNPAPLGIQSTSAHAA